jgi:thymidylate synthase
MNTLDKQYQELLQDILDNGVTKMDRTGTGILSVFGRQIRHRMSDGFPVVTTKKLHFKGVVSELLWFLNGRTDLRYLLEHNNFIWVGDAYKKYMETINEIIEHYKSGDMLGSQPHIENMFSDSDNLIPLSEKEFIEKIKSDDEFDKKFGDLGPIYGRQWRSWEKYKWNKLDFEFRIEYIDQIANLINDLKTNPDSRRLMVNAWNVGELDQMTLPPCHYGFQVYTRELGLEERKKIYERDYTDGVEVQNDHWLESKLTTRNVPTRAISLMYNARSQDVPLGTPFNISSYALLLEIIGKIVNMIPDELIANMGDCHIYLNQIDGIKEQLTREPYELPTLDIHPGMLDYDLDKLPIGLFTLKNYQSHPSIKMPLSN